MQMTCGWGDEATRQAACKPGDAGYYSIQCDDDDLLDWTAYERTRLDVSGEARSLRCVPRAVWRWSRTKGGVAFGGDRCNGPTLLGTVAARSRAWSDHVRSVVASAAMLELEPVKGEC